MAGDGKGDIELFTEATQLAEEARCSFLDEVCAGDPDQRSRIEALLESNKRAGDFLETPPTAAIGEARVKIAVGEKPGDWVEHYKLIKQIGEGGWGVVFVAEQEKPVRRRVALKVVKPGMDTKSVIARFEAERQALALMDHPNIAHAYDAGSTDSGRPYFVMELVDGVKITEYCDRRSLPTTARLELFVEVCDAIQHAHQKGIIHRDIKPSNILVTTAQDGKPTPKVIDFGIAKATGGRHLTDQTIFTAQEMLIGTPAYMSPEQVTLASTELDTRTDIYSLGVLLHELLTGTTPFDANALLQAGIDEIRRVVREVEPIRPSTRLTTMRRVDLNTVCAHRQEQPSQLIRQLRGDLDWIVMMALEKDRARRYKTVNGLALDVRRFLLGETVMARPPSKVYRMQKIVLRNKALFAGAGVIAWLLIVSLVVVSVALSNERQSRLKADQASARSQQLITVLEDMLNGAGPRAAQGQDSTMLKGILDQTAARIDRELTNQPAIKAEILALMGRLYEQIANSRKGEEMERLALDIRREAFGPESLEVASSLNDLGLVLMAQHKTIEAKEAHSHALAIRRRLLGDNNPDTATSLNDLAAAHRDQGKLKEAENMANRALNTRRKLFGDDHLDVADSLRNLSIIYGSQGRWREARATAYKVLNIRTNKLGPDHPFIPSTLEDVAWAASGLEQFDEARKVEAEALVIRDKVLGPAHPDVARTLNALGQLLGHHGELATAEAILKATLSIQLSVVGEDNQATVETLDALGRILKDQGKTSEAEPILLQADALWRKRGGGERADRLLTRGNLAEVFERQGKWQEAEAVWRESLVLWRRLRGYENGDSMYTLRKLALALEAERKWPEAESAHREALSLSSKKGVQDQEALADREKLARVLITEKKFVQAEALLNEVLTPAFIAQPLSTPLIVQRVNAMGRRGHWRQAAADAALALENQPAEHYRYHTLASLLAILGDRAAYEKICKQMVGKFPNPANPFVAERITQDCLLLPDCGVDLELIDRLADSALNNGSGDDSLPYFQACRAMASYRLGDNLSAIAWAEKAVNSSAAFAQAKAYAILALAHQRLGRDEVARAMLAKGETLTPAKPRDQDAQDIGESWVAWLQARISLNEAAAQITTSRAN